MKTKLTIALALAALALAIAPAAQAIERVNFRTLGGVVSFHVPSESSCYDPGDRFPAWATFRRNRGPVGRSARPLRAQFLREGRVRRNDRRRPFAYALRVPFDARIGRLEYTVRLQVRTRQRRTTVRTWVTLDRHVLVQPKSWASCD